MMKSILFGLMVFLATSAAGTANAQTPQVVEAAAPGYPRLPSGARESGEVQVEISIAASGEVVSAKALTGPDRLRPVAEGAARKWRFKAQDRPTEKWTITFGFNLRPGLGDPPLVASVFKGPDRVDVFGEERKVVTISDPPVEDVDKVRKKQKKQ
jgi:TonB family protein